MSFLAPYLLWGGLAATIPVVVHLFFRARYRTVYWAAMRFLRQAMEQTSRRLRLQELLLLWLRILVLLLLALALARPTTQVVLGGVSGEAVDAVILLDHSMSMDAKDGALTRLERARAAAKAAVANLPPNSTVQIIAVSDRAALIGPRRSADLDQANAAIDQIKVTSRGTNLAPGFQLALEALRRGTAPNRELYVLTDGQTSGFDQQTVALAEAARDCRKLATIYLCRCGRELERNATITGIAPQSGLPHVGQRISFAVLVKNTGRETVRDLVVSLSADGDDRRRESQPVPRLEPGETRAVTLSTRWNEPGLHAITANLQSDELSADDQYDRVIRVRDRVRVLVVDGSPAGREAEKASSYYLLHALLPIKESEKSRYFLQARLASPSKVTPQQLSEYDLCILANVRLLPEAGQRGEVLPAEFVSGLDRFVREGRSLIVFCGDQVVPGDYAKVLLDRWPLLPMRPTAVRNYAENAETGIDRTSLTDPAFTRFRDDETYQSISQMKTRRLVAAQELPAEEGRSATKVLMRATDGNPLIASRSVGAGSVAMVATSADVTWTDMALWVNAYVPLIDALMVHMLVADAHSLNVPCGQGVKWNVPNADADRTFVLVHPSGHRHRLGKPEPVNGRPRIAGPDTPQAGLYRLQPHDAPDSVGVTFAATMDADEAMHPELLSDDGIAERLSFAPTFIRVTDDLSPFHGGERLKQEWSTGLLWAVLLLALVETMLARLISRAG